VGIVEDNDGQSSRGIDPIPDGGLEIGEELGLAVGGLSGELVIEQLVQIVWADGAQRLVDELVVGIREPVDPGSEGGGFTGARRAGEKEETAMFADVLQASDQLLTRLGVDEVFGFQVLGKRKAMQIEVGLNHESFSCL
jgi:hypothetical protein